MAASVGSLDATERSPLIPRAAKPYSAVSEGHVAPKLSSWRAASIILSFGILIFLQSANFSVMSTTSTAVASDLNAYNSTSWFTSVYMMALSCMSPLSGRLSQIFDPRNFALGTAIVFAVGALITSQATSLWVFLFGRVIQGVGASGIYTLSVNLVIYLVDTKRRGLFIGGSNSCITLGVALGAVIGGLLVESIGWRPLLWLQAPIALISALCLFVSIPSISKLRPTPQQSIGQKLRSIDYVGGLLLVGTLASLLLGLGSSQIQAMPILISGGLLVLFVLQELYRAKSPAIPLTLLSSRGVLLSAAMQLGFMTTRWGILYYTPVYMLAVRCWTPARSGLILIPTNIGFAFGGLIVGWLHIRQGGSYYAPALFGLAVFPLTVAALATMATATASESPLGPLIAVVALNGVLAGGILNYSLAHLLHIAPPSAHFVATALVATARGIAGSFGTGIGGGIFGRRLHLRLAAEFARRGLDADPASDRLRSRLQGSPALVCQLSGPEKEAAIAAYASAVRAVLWAAAVLGLLGLALHAGTGWSSWEQRAAAHAPAGGNHERSEHARNGPSDEDNALLDEDRLVLAGDNEQAVPTDQAGRP